MFKNELEIILLDGNKMIFKIVSDLKRLIRANEIESSHIFHLVHNLLPITGLTLLGLNQYSKAVNAPNKEADRLLHRCSSSSLIDSCNYIQMKALIKKMEFENMKLRESNVKLQRESKLQDQQIRHLNHQIACKERKIHQNNLEKAKIERLRGILRVKRSEIQNLQQDLQVIRRKIKQEQKVAKQLREDRQKMENTSKSNENFTVGRMVDEIDLLLKELIKVVKIWTCQRALVEKHSEVTPLDDELLKQRKILRAAIRELLQIMLNKKRSKCLLQVWMLQNLADPTTKKQIRLPQTFADKSVQIKAKSEKSSDNFLSGASFLSNAFSLRRCASDTELQKSTCGNIIY